MTLIFLELLYCKQIITISFETSSAGAELSDGPHKEGLRRARPNDFLFVYTLIQRDLSMSTLFVLLVMFSIFSCDSSSISHNVGLSVCMPETSSMEVICYCQCSIIVITVVVVYNIRAFCHHILHVSCDSSSTSHYISL